MTRLEPIAHAEELIHARPAQVDMAPTGLYLHSDPPDHRFGQTFYLMCVHTSAFSLIMKIQEEGGGG